MDHAVSVLQFSQSASVASTPFVNRRSCVRALVRQMRLRERSMRFTYLLAFLFYMPDCVTCFVSAAVFRSVKMSDLYFVAGRAAACFIAMSVYRSACVSWTCPDM